MSVGRVALLNVGTRDLASSEGFPWKMGEVSAKPVARSQTQESHCDKQSEANVSCNVDVESHVKRQEYTAQIRRLKGGERPLGFRV